MSFLESSPYDSAERRPLEEFQMERTDTPFARLTAKNPRLFWSSPEVGLRMDLAGYIGMRMVGDPGGLRSR